MQALQRALSAQDAAAVRAAVDQALMALGPWAGQPEIATRYFPPVNTSAFDQAKLRAWWLQEISRGLGNVPWVSNPQGDPRIMTNGLREAAYPLDALARSAALFPEQRNALQTQVRTGADWLLQRQHASGVFPFPVGPGLNPRDKVGRSVEHTIRANPSIVVNDWIANDLGDGSLQFDNGLSGGALINAWALTRDARYLAAARKAGDWAIAQQLVTNWNYNAFSVGFLARLFSATGEDKYLQAALKKTQLGVLPGQLPSGRWFDPHNACAVYHNILLRELLELLHALPSQHPYRSTLLDAITRGINQAAAETLAKGYTGTWTESFARGLQWIGENPAWRQAMNASIQASGKGKAPALGVAAIPVLEGVR